MTTCFLAPDPIQSTQFIPGGAVPANGGQLFFYVAGSSTKQTVYKDNAAAVAHTNPIVLDSGGNIPSGGEIWFPSGQTFKCVFAPSTDTDPPVSPYWTKDNLGGINDTAITLSEWVAGGAPTFSSGTVLTLSGDQTAIYTSGRRIKSTNTAGTIYSTILTSTFGGGITTITVLNDSGALDAGLSAVFYGLLSVTNYSVPPDITNVAATSITAGNTTDIWRQGGNYAHVTGVTAIRNFSTARYVGQSMQIVFDNSTTIFTSAAVLLPQLSNWTTNPGDTALIRADNLTTARFMSFDYAALQTQGASNIRFQRTVLYNSGALLTPSSTGLFTTTTGCIGIFVQCIGGGAGGQSPGGGATTAAEGGSTTTFGAGLNLLATGGLTAANPGQGGAKITQSGTNDYAIAGAAGSPSTPCVSTFNNLVLGIGGNGGNSVFGGGGTGGYTTASDTNMSGLPLTGGGGGGQCATTQGRFAGGGGGAGGYVARYFPIPLGLPSTYAYTSGTCGSPGSSGAQSGGYGGVGCIIIDQYFK